MNISSGIAEIGFGDHRSGRIAGERFYLWPIYAAGRVENVRGVARRTEGNGVYIKPAEEDREKILALSRDRTRNEYTLSGAISRPARSVQPGSLFDALV